CQWQARRARSGPAAPCPRRRSSRRARWGNGSSRCSLGSGARVRAFPGASSNASGCTSAEERHGIVDRALVAQAEVVERGDGVVRVALRGQAEGVEAAARQVEEVVAADVAEGAQLALPAMARA